MDSLQNILGILDLMVQPAFCVEEGMIVGANREAQRFLIQPDTPIYALLSEDPVEYREFRDGCLYLTVNILGHSFGASVTKNNGYDIFVLEQDADQAELNAMALAAQELREPLANVMAVADRLFPVVGTDDSVQVQVSRINRGLFQMLRIIGNMSDAARYAQDTPQNQEIRDISAVFEEIFSKAGALLEQTGIRFQFRNLPERTFTLTDVEKLERAVYNLLSNAMKFTPRDGSIEANLTRRGNRVYLTIQDSGSGVDPNIRNSIHQRYLRQPGLEDGRFGIGLGMVLIRAAAAAHGGTVLIEHPSDSGARITMTLMLRQDNSGNIRSTLKPIDYAGERDHGLIELSECLPASFYHKDLIN